LENPRKRSLAILIPAIVGITGLFTVLARPRASAYASVDILELVAGGMCLGIALVALVQWIRGNRPS